jgi:hypothetical protein
MDAQEIDNLLNQGILIANTLSQEKILELTKKFAPMKTEHELVRLGPMFDGGYLVPNDMANISACFSPGVSNYAFFEDDLLAKYGINSHQADFSVNGPPHGFKPLSFTKKFLGAHNDSTFITLEKWVKDSWEYELSQDLLLQMDIEGAEYETLLATPDFILKKFRIIVLEVHGIDKWGLAEFYPIANALINKLQQHFIVVHNHPNNHGGEVSINGVIVPRTIEITLHRKDRCKKVEPAVQIPHPFDAACGSTIPDFELAHSFRK